jgi:hypothetical protein
MVKFLHILEEQTPKQIKFKMAAKFKMATKTKFAYVAKKNLVRLRFNLQILGWKKINIYLEAPKSKIATQSRWP